MKTKRGIFVTVEGIDGAGKGTHVRAMKEYFEGLGHEVVTTRDPGGTELGEQLRKVLLKDKMHPLSEVLLLMAGRNEHLEKVIRPALARGATVICERYTDSTLAFQCGGRGLDESKVLPISAVVHGDMWPDLTLVFDVDPDIAAARMDGRTLDKFEAEDVMFHERVVDYYARTDNFPFSARVRYVNAREDIATTERLALHVLQDFMSERAADEQVRAENVVQNTTKVGGDILYPQQRTAVNHALQDLKRQRFAIIRAGQRSGKNVMEGQIAGSFKLVSVFAGISAHGHEAARAVTEGWIDPPEILHGVWPGEDRTIDPSLVLLIIDEAFWNPVSYEQFNHALEKGYSVLVMGTAGPYLPRFKSLGGQSYATWELNPSITRESLTPQFAEDYEKATRDYGAA